MQWRPTERLLLSLKSYIDNQYLLFLFPCLIWNHVGLHLLLGLHLPVYLCFCWFLAHKLLHASDSTVPYEVHFGDTGQLSNTENISTDACFHGCMFLPQASICQNGSSPAGGFPFRGWHSLHKQSELWRSWLQQCSVLWIAVALI